MSRLVAGVAKVVRRTNEAIAKVMLPNTVHDHSSRQRIVFAGNPVRQLQTQAGRRSRTRRQSEVAIMIWSKGQCPGADRFERLIAFTVF